MSKSIFPLLFGLLVVWLAGATWWFDKKYNQYEDLDKGKCVVPFAVKDGSFQTKSENTIMFELSNWEPTIPMQTLASLKSIALYLANSQKKVLILKGRFGTTETNNSDFANNGIARAEAIKSELVTYGAPAEKIKIEADSVEQIELVCGKIMNGVDFSFLEKQQPIAQNTATTTTPKKEDATQKNEHSTASTTTVTTSTNTETVATDFRPKKKFIVFYRENRFKPEVDEEIDTYFKGLSKYLKAHPRYRLLLVGHTDNKGSKDKHFNFGKYRARKLRDVLLSYGIEKRRIKTDSKGSSKPLGSNSTPEGRFKNRRVEISIIKR